MPGAILQQFMLKQIFLFFSLIIFTQFVHAQTIDDLSDLKVEELTDDQIRRFIVDADRLGIKDEQIDAFAIERGMNPVELAKLKERIQAIRKVLNSSNYQAQKAKPSPTASGDSASMLEQQPLSAYANIFSGLRARNFGWDVFNNPKL